MDFRRGKPVKAMGSQVYFTVYMTARDEPPLLEFLRNTGGRIIRLFSPDWPPVPIEGNLRESGEDECLATWHPEIIDENELQLPDCIPEIGPHGCYDAWSSPFVVFQRLWYWKQQATVFAVEQDYRAFRPNRPEDAAFSPEEIADFNRRLETLRRRANAIRGWSQRNLLRGYIGEDAWQKSQELRQFG